MPQLRLTFIAVAVLLNSGARAHSYMAIPTPRPVTDAYRAKVSPQFATAADEAIQRAPLENFAGGSLDMNNGCRGFEFDATNPIVEITPGQKLDVLWLTQATHPGPITMNVVRPKVTGGKTKWEATESVPLTNVGGATTLKAPKTINGYQNFQAVANIPAALTGCDQPGDCALQWVLDSTEIGQHYFTCADMVVKGSTKTGGEAATPALTPAAPKPASPRAPAPPTPTPKPAAPPKPPSGNTKCVRRLRV